MTLTIEGATKLFKGGWWPTGTDRYLALHTGTPTAANECSWTDYARQTISRSEVSVATSGATNPGRITLTGTETYPSTSADGTQDPTHWAIWDVASGTANVLAYGALTNNPDAPDANEIVRFAANSIWLDPDLANSTLTHDAWTRGVTGSGIVGTDQTAIALYSDAALTTELSGNNYAQISAIPASEWEISSTGVLQLNASKNFQIASGTWSDIGSLGVLQGSTILFGGPLTGTDPEPLVNGQRFTIAANAVSFDFGGVVADITGS